MREEKHLDMLAVRRAHHDRAFANGIFYQWCSPKVLALETICSREDASLKHDREWTRVSSGKPTPQVLGCTWHQHLNLWNVSPQHDYPFPRQEKCHRKQPFISRGKPTPQVLGCPWHEHLNLWNVSPQHAYLFPRQEKCDRKQPFLFRGKPAPHLPRE